MKQVLQNLKTGETEVTDMPLPATNTNCVLIQTSKTLISTGTEKMLVDFGSASLVNKARQQPDKVRMVLDKVRTDGLALTVDAVLSKLNQPIPLGYCNFGVVAEVGNSIQSFSVGDRVVSNGNHAEFVSVPRILCAPVPDSVSDEHATFTVPGAIGLQGIRLVNPTLGECVVVTGLGLIGLLTVQMLKAQGCRVLGIDFNSDRLDLARRFGAATVDLSKGEDPLAEAASFSRGRGVDAVLITASSKSSEPVRQAANMCRKRGRIVLVGVTGLELSRTDFYEKELTFQVSCSYGPGRYDANYEERGQDYPVGFVRWTEQRNFEAVLDLMATGKLDVGPLISHRFPFDKAVDAYELLGSGEPALGILLDYDHSAGRPEKGWASRVVDLPASSAGDLAATFGVIGAGNYAGRVLLPALKKAGARLGTVVSSSGVSGVHHGKKHGFARAATDAEIVFADKSVSAVVIATRHDSHAKYVLRAIESGKHVFVEKPLCLSHEELGEIEKAVEGRPDLMLMVGFNRRFSPLVVKMKGLLAGVSGPKSFIMTVNAGDVSADHWTQDLQVGGGRIVGEGCHFIDLLRHLAGSVITGHSAISLVDNSGGIITSDKSSITLSFADGSFGVIHYLANGHKAYPKERLDVFCAGKVLQLDNFRLLKGWGWKGFSGMRLWRQDKGVQACIDAFVARVRGGGEPLIPLSEIIEVSRVSIELGEELR